jgi:hypothetical protein
MKMSKLGGLVLVWLCLTVRANAGVTVLLEEPYSYDGAFAGTGHTAVYLTRVCSASPTVLRRCYPGEAGVVISRYNRIAGYDWIAIPLLPYLQRVAKPEFDLFGRPILRSATAYGPVSLGISRSNLLSHAGPSGLQCEFLVARLRQELTAGRAPRSSSIGVRHDMELLQKLVAAQREGVTATASIGDRGRQTPSN